MTIYELNFTIDQSGVDTINGAGQYITVVKSVGGGGKTPVAWLTFPAEPTTQVSWEEVYWIYATKTVTQGGVVITSTAMTSSPVATGLIYPLSPDGEFGSGAKGGPSGSFNVQNNSGDNKWQFGVAQKATVGGVETLQPVPLNLVQVLNNETAYFTPELSVSIFLQNISGNGVVITDANVLGDALTLTPALVSVRIQANIGFNDAENVFLDNTVAHPLPGGSYGEFRKG